MNTSLPDRCPFVNEENRPFLGFNEEVPLIIGDGNPIIDLENYMIEINNKVVQGFLSLVPRDNMGIPIKVFLNENDGNKYKNRNNEINDNNNDNDEKEDNNNIIAQNLVIIVV